MKHNNKTISLLDGCGTIDAVLKEVKVSLLSDFYDTNPTAVALPIAVDIVVSNPEVKQTTLQHRHFRQKACAKDVSGSEILQAKKMAQKLKQQHPIIIPAAICQGGKKAEHLVRFTSVYCADLDHIPEEMLAEVKKRLREDPHTLFYGSSPSGEGIRAMFWHDGAEALNEGLEERSMPQRARTYEYIWSQCAEWVEQLTGVKDDGAGKSAVHGFSLAHDPEAYVNWEAVPLHVDVAHMPQVKVGRPKKAVAKAAGKGAEVAEVALSKVESLIADTLERHAVNLENGRNSYLYAFAVEANRYGVAQEEVMEWARELLLAGDFAESEIAATVESAYKRTVEHGTCGTDNVVEQVKALIAQTAELRYNEVSMQMEVSFLPPRENPLCQWHPMTDRDADTLYSFVRGYRNIARNQVDAFINAHGFAASYHPVRAYLASLPEWHEEDGDHILEFFHHLCLRNAKDAEFVFKLFRMWFIRMVAMGMGVIEHNQIVPILIGPEGIGKTFFLEQMLPPELREYYRHVDPNEKLDKDFTISVSQAMLINFDEYTIGRSESNQIKSIISGGARKVRVPYGRHAQRIRPIASFAITTNERLCIAMDDGIRRFFPLDIVSTLNLNDFPINYEQLYAQAYHEVVNGHYDMALTPDEIARLRELNSPYTETDPCQEAIWRAYSKPEANEPGSKWVTATDIRKRIFYGMSRDEITSQRINKAMTQLGFEQSSRNRQKLFYVREKAN